MHKHCVLMVSKHSFCSIRSATFSSLLFNCHFFSWIMNFWSKAECLRDFLSGWWKAGDSFNQKEAYREQAANYYCNFLVGLWFCEFTVRQFFDLVILHLRSFMFWLLMFWQLFYYAILQLGGFMIWHWNDLVILSLASLLRWCVSLYKLLNISIELLLGN